MSADDELIDRFVASFANFDELSAPKELDSVAWQLRTGGDTDQFGYHHWSPAKASLDPSSLDALYAKLPARFPPLYERLVLSYRWAEVDLRLYRLLANPPGIDLSGLLDQMSRAPDFSERLLPAGYLPFGKGPDLDFDPVCFDIKAKTSSDYRIVKLDHEEILCKNRLKVVAELAPSFRQLVLNTIAPTTAG
jgi:hypothetical protein